MKFNISRPIYIYIELYIDINYINTCALYVHKQITYGFIYKYMWVIFAYVTM